MDTQRLLLYLALGFLSLIIYQTWITDYHAPLEPVAREAPANDTSVPGDAGSLPAAPSGDVPGGSGVGVVDDLPGAPTGGTNIAADASPGANVGGPADPDTPRVHVRTDVMDIEIDTTGATIDEVDLLKYAVSIEEPNVPFTLVSNDPAHYLVAQSGLQSTEGMPAPIHREPMRVEASEYSLDDGLNAIVVPFYWEKDGIKVTKTLTFTRDSYEIGVAYTIENGTDAPYVVNQYRQLKRKPGTKDERQQFVNTYIGGVWSNPEDRYNKVKFDDMEDENLSAPVTDGWVAMIQHYFATAWIPTEGEKNTAYTRWLPSENRFVIGMVSAPVTVPAGGTTELATQAYIGPKVQDHLAAVAPNLELVVDYGWLTIIAQPLFWVLKTIHGLIGNWGFAIIFTTFLIKAMFYKLSEASYKSMARMKRLQPKLATLKERHGDDRAAMGQATMELYKKEKVNPLGGCLPMILQIPVFIALYWTLLESIELRQAPWILWIHDLSIRDPYFILPVIMAATMFFQQKLNPAPVDPIQQKVFQFLPLIFGVFFAFFPAGLVLYWIVNNSLSIAQQYYITKHVIGDGKGGGSSPAPISGDKGGKGGGLGGRLSGLLGKGSGTRVTSTPIAASAVPAGSGIDLSKGGPFATDVNAVGAGLAESGEMSDAQADQAARTDGAGREESAPASVDVPKAAPGGTPKPHKRGKQQRKKRRAS